jgi:hypothetical protein
MTGELMLIMVRFMGGWHFLNGGLLGLDDIRPAGGELYDKIEDFDRYGVRVLYDDNDDAPPYEGMIELSAATECDGFQHAIVPPKLWQRIVGKDNAKPGEYCYFSHASWRGEIEFYHSIRDWVAKLVEEVEDMIERGEKVVQYGEDGEEIVDDDEGQS